MEEFAVSIEGLKKTYRSHVALDGITVNLNKNQIIGLIGANGSGKTTLMKICTGLEGADSGRIRMFGEDARTMIIGGEMIYTMHDLPVGRGYGISEIIRFYKIAYTDFDENFCKKLLELFEIPLKKSCSALSQGMKSAVHFSCAMATRCRLTLFDEPFIGMDIAKRKLAYEVLLRDYMEHPRTILLSSHNLLEIEGLLSEMLLIHKGKLVFYQDMDDVREMLFRVDGKEEEISGFVEKEDTIYMEKKEIESFAILRGSVESDLAAQALKRGLTVSAVTPEDVSVYLTMTKERKGTEDLWEC